MIQPLNKFGDLVSKLANWVKLSVQIPRRISSGSWRRMVLFDLVVIFAKEVSRKETKKKASTSASNRIADFLCMCHEELLYEIAQYSSNRQQLNKYYSITV